MKYVSLFAGIGGFDLALNRLGHVCVWANEWDKYAAQIYNRKFWNKYQATGEAPHTEGTSSNASSNNVERTSQGIDTRDITTVPTSEIPDHDLLVGGFPCQAFSIAGKRRGFDDTRGTLFFDVARILKDKQPKFFILENVKGLLSHDYGRTFLTIISTLDDIGYDLQWQVLNSKNFGVPQNRERVFIVGHIRGERRPEIFPIGDSGAQDSKSTEELPVQLSNTLRTGYGTKWSNETYVLEQLNNPTHSNDRVYADTGISPTLNTMQGGNRQPKIAVPVLTPDRAEKRQNGRRFKGDGDPSFTLTGQDKHGVFDGAKIRRLTPTECERLQGFPDGWTEYGLSSIMEICVNTSPAIEKQLPKSDIVCSTTKDGSVMELLSYPNGLKSSVSIVVEGLLPVSFVIDTISRGNDMVMLYNQNEILKDAETIKQSLTLEETEGKSTKMLLNLYLEGSWNEEKLSTILTLIKETIASPTSMFARTDESIIGVIIHLKKQGSNFLKEASFGLRMASTSQISDTQRYKCLGNAVTVNVVYEIAGRLKPTQEEEKK